MSSRSNGGDYDAIVVGLGGIGSAALYRLARSGARVLGLEQFELGHDRGASQDESRIIRLSYHRPEYVELAKRAYVSWRELEAEADARVITITGGLDLAPPGAAESIEDYAASMSVAGVPFEWLDAAELARRWPQWQLHSDTRGLYQPDAGIADPSVGNAAHQQLALAHGADVRERARVTELRDHRGELEVRTADGRTFAAGSVVLATDAWTNDLLAPLGRPLPLRVTLEQVSWFEARDPGAFASGRFPIWIWLDLPSFYGFPAHRQRGPKVGEDLGGRETTADTRTFDPDPAVAARLRRFLDQHLPRAFVHLQGAKTCLYTTTPDRDFIVDRLPEAPNVVVALGAAHAYKFAALMGILLAELALDGQCRPPPAELDLFAIDRPALDPVDAHA
ncbi:MAG TPA: N-methyl-L-tryptophan oxidase [Candidatus Limnocylindrales bacterium]|nr:N-methyl-L-tryptophan oxidase [Candidatus Limnocylindrales bacterium]